MAIRSERLGICALLWLSVPLAGCDQFARVGVGEDARSETPPESSPDAGPLPHDDTDASLDDGSQDSGAPCTAPEIAVCDPLKNQGCPTNLAMHCAVDLLSSSAAGYCIYTATTSLPGEACFNSGLTESCPPTYSCVDTFCEKLCFCDDECGEGKCCKRSVGMTPFKICGDC